MRQVTHAEHALIWGGKGRWVLSTPRKPEASPPRAVLRAPGRLLPAFLWAARVLVSRRGPGLAELLREEGSPAPVPALLSSQLLEEDDEEEPPESSISLSKGSEAASDSASRPRPHLCARVLRIL